MNKILIIQVPVTAGQVSAARSTTVGLRLPPPLGFISHQEIDPITWWWLCECECVHLSVRGHLRLRAAALCL